MEENKNTLYIGIKPTMTYVLSLVSQFHNNVAKVVVKARGRAISKAVDVVEIARNKFIKELRIESIDINSEEFKTDRGSRSVSAMTITVKKENSNDNSEK